jgi:multidrug resistance protein MdtO
MYLFPNVETIGGFWLVFGAGTAVAAWANFGTPRISYGGYQVGLAFYKAVFQGFGPATSATNLRDRLIGIFFGLIVFGAVEHLLWPVRARDALRARLTEMLRSLAQLARAGAAGRTPLEIDADVDAWRRRVAEKVKDVQELIESSKFESGDLTVSEIQTMTGDAQIVFLLLLSLARGPGNVAQSKEIQSAAAELDSAIAAALESLAGRAAGGTEPPRPLLEEALNAFERATRSDTLDREAATYFDARLQLYRKLVATIERLSLEFLDVDAQRDRASKGEMLLERREIQIN